MEKLHEFALSFVDAEYQCNQAQYNITILDDEMLLMKGNVEAFFHPIASERFGRVGVEFEDEMMKMLSAKKLQKILRRKIFKENRYHDPNYGDAIARTVVGPELFSFDTSYDEDGGRPIYLSRRYFVAETDEGFRIIYYLRFDTDSGTWRHSHDHQPTQVLDPGTLVETLRLTAPEDPMSLAEYNRD